MDAGANVYANTSANTNVNSSILVCEAVRAMHLAIEEFQQC